ncbi:MAG: hypothetical protein ACK5DE_03625 [Bacteroidota bacterium]
MKIEIERKETVQDVIDRLLYLPADKLAKYKHFLDTLVELYPIDVRVVDGVRIYNVTKNKLDGKKVQDS